MLTRSCLPVDHMVWLKDVTHWYFTHLLWPPCFYTCRDLHQILRLSVATFKGLLQNLMGSGNVSIYLTVQLIWIISALAVSEISNFIKNVLMLLLDNFFKLTSDLFPSSLDTCQLGSPVSLMYHLLPVLGEFSVRRWILYRQRYIVYPCRVLVRWLLYPVVQYPPFISVGEK